MVPRNHFFLSHMLNALKKFIHSIRSKSQEVYWIEILYDFIDFVEF